VKIALIGFNGKLNFGDDVMTEVIIKTLLNKLKVKELFILGEKNKTNFNYLNPYNSLTKFTFSSPFLSFIRKINVVGGLYLRYLTAYKIAVQYDLIIIGGGTLYHSYLVNAFYLNIIRFKNLFNRRAKVISIGVSIGPFRSTNAEENFKKILKQLDFLSVRDNRSLNLCKLLNTKQQVFSGADIAMGFPFIHSLKEAQQSNKTIGIILRQGHVTKSDQEFLIKTIQYISENFPNKKFNFYSFCELENKLENDYLAITEFLSQLSPTIVSRCEIIRYTGYPAETCAHLISNNFNICIRLHASVMSYVYNVPFLMVSYHKKCEDFFADNGIEEKFLVSTNKPFEYYKKLIYSLAENTEKRAFIPRETYLNHFAFLNLLVNNYNENFDFC
jgi:polysaccharide pyruvyl transferase WcaK-like protein